MEVRGEPFAGGYEVDGLVRNEVRLDGRNTVTHDTFYFVECTNQVDESLARRLAEVADIDSGQHDFFSTFGSSRACSTILAIVPLRLRPRAKGMVQ